MRRIASGVASLDDILGGGIPEYSSILVAGKPGTGKTILTQNILFNNARNGKVLYITTMSEPQLEVIRYQQEFAFFDKDIFMKSMIYHDIGSIIRRKGIEEFIKAIDELVHRHRPVLVAAGSLKAISDILTSDAEFREFVFDLALRLSLWECTVLLVGEYPEKEINSRPEAAISGGIIYMYGMEEQKRQTRYLRILKMRGTDFAAGQHLYRITNNGIKIYPRLRPVVTKQSYSAVGKRQSTGITGLDWMMDGGIPGGTTTLVTGATGTGKTLLALGWIVTGARAGEPGLLITFDENPEQLINSVRPFGWDLKTLIDEGLLKILHVSPIELSVDELIYHVKEIADEVQAKRLVIDSISTFKIGMPDQIKYTDFIWSMTDYFKTQGISVILINGMRELFAVSQVTDRGIPYVAGNILIMQYEKVNREIRRLVGVLKMRGSTRDVSPRELTAGGGGLEPIEQPEEVHESWQIS